MNNKTFNTSIPSLCEPEEFIVYLKDIWASGILTHNGPLIQKLEKEICESLNIKQYLSVTNGTTALQLAIEALDIKGTILVPAFSWFFLFSVKFIYFAKGLLIGIIVCDKDLALK